MGAKFHQAEPRQLDDVQKIELQPDVPVFVADVQQRTFGAMAGAVDNRVNAAPPRQRGVQQTLQVSGVVVVASHTRAA